MLLPERRLRKGQPHLRWKTSTVVAMLMFGGMVVPFVPGGPINRLAFSRLKANLRKAIARVLEAFQPEERRNDFAVAGHDPN